MSKRYALVENDAVLNVALWDDNPEDGRWLLLPDDSPVAPGDVRQDGVWVRPTLPEVVREPNLAERLAAVETELRGMRERAAAATSVTGGAATIRDAITGPGR